MPPSKGVIWSMGSGPAGVTGVAAAEAEVLVDFMPALWRELRAVALMPLNENCRPMQHESRTGLTQDPAPHEMISQ